MKTEPMTDQAIEGLTPDEKMKLEEKLQEMRAERAFQVKMQLTWQPFEELLAGPDRNKIRSWLKGRIVALDNEEMTRSFRK